MSLPLLNFSFRAVFKKIRKIGCLPLPISTIPMIVSIAMQRSFAYVKASCKKTAALTLIQFTTVTMAERKKALDYNISKWNIGNFHQEKSEGEMVYLAPNARIPEDELKRLNPGCDGSGQTILISKKINKGGSSNDVIGGGVASHDHTHIYLKLTEQDFHGVNCSLTPVPRFFLQAINGWNVAYRKAETFL